MTEKQAKKEDLVEEIIEIKEEENHNSFKEKSDKLKTSIKDTLSDLKKSETVNELKNYTLSHKEESASIFILLIGLAITAWSNMHAGQAIVGLVLGFYFFKEIVNVALSIKNYYEQAGLFKILILIGLFITLMISSPFLLIGTTSSVLIKLAIKFQQSKK